MDPMQTSDWQASQHWGWSEIFSLWTVCLLFIFFGHIYIVQIRDHHTNKRHSPPLWKDVPKLSTLTVRFICSVHAAPTAKHWLFHAGYCAKAFSRKYHCLVSVTALTLSNTASFLAAALVFCKRFLLKYLIFSINFLSKVRFSKQMQWSGDLFLYLLDSNIVSNLKQNSEEQQ